MKQILTKLVFALAISLPLQLHANEEILASKGIDPAVIDTMLSSFEQKEEFVMQMEFAVTKGDAEPVNTKLYAIHEPDTEYGLDIYFKYDSQNEKLDDIGDYEDLLKGMMKTQHRLQNYGNQYDPDSLKVIADSNNRTTFQYKYFSYGLPQDIAFARHLTGTIEVENNELKTIYLTNHSNFNHNFKSYTTYHQVATFTKAPNGEYVKVSQHSVLEFTRWGTKYRVEVTAKFIQYKFPDTEQAFVIHPDLNVDLSLPRYETIRIDLDRTFPLWGKAVRKRGYDLPLPYGINLIARKQFNEINFTSFKINGEQEIIEAIFEPNGSNAEVDAGSVGIRGDMFILPFLNVFGALSKVEANNQLTINTTDGVQRIINIVELITGQPIGSTPTELKIDMNLDLEVATLGATAAVGYKNYFGSLTASYSHSITKQANTSTTI